MIPPEIWAVYRMRYHKSGYAESWDFVKQCNTEDDACKYAEHGDVVVRYKQHAQYDALNVTLRQRMLDRE